MYINHQGGLRSPRLYILAHRLILWSSVHHLSLRDTHLLGLCGADLLSRGDALHGEWKVHLEFINQI